MPETMVGCCPFCEREGVTLSLITGRPCRGPDGEIVVPVDWVCAWCMAAIDEDRKRRAEADAHGEGTVSG